MSETVEYFEDIDIGDEIAELEICPTTADVVRFVDVARMQSGRFTDDAYARQEGLPGAIVPGNMSLGFLSRMLTEFFPTGTIRVRRSVDTFGAEKGQNIENVRHQTCSSLSPHSVLGSDLGCLT